MKKELTLYCLLLSTAICVGQSFREDATALLQVGKIAEAEELTNRMLVEDPTNVDAITMKGNVLLNKYLYEEQAGRSVLPSFEEDIYRSDQLEKPLPPVVVPLPLAREIAKLWTAAGRLDPLREDIQLGLCQLYSLALMKDELLAQLPVVKEKAAGVEDLPFHLTAYARNLKDRGDLAGAMAVNRAIFRMFPSHTGLLSDMAGDYYFAGQADSARHYVLRTMEASNADESSLGNAFFLSALLADHDLALEALRRLPGNSHLLYEGLLKFCRNDKKWQKPLVKFLEGSPDTVEAVVARLLLADTFRLDLENYLSLSAFDIGDPLKLLLHQKFQETGLFLPYFNEAEAFCFHKNYALAEAAFQRLASASPPMEPEEQENLLFYRAWSLHQLGKQQAALPMWEALLASADFYRQSAACWFLGHYYFENGDKLKARDYFMKVADRPAESKFATMCWQFMGID